MYNSQRERMNLLITCGFIKAVFNSRHQFLCRLLLRSCFSHFVKNSFLGHSAQSVFKHICSIKQSPMNGVVKNEIKNRNKIKPNFRCPLLEVCSYRSHLPSLMLVGIGSSPFILSLGNRSISNNENKSK